MLHIERFADSWPMRLSGGQRQRVSIARALALDPAVVLMDEPFSTLDEVTGRTMRQQLVELWAESGKTIIFVTHSIREALYLEAARIGHGWR
jgi:NitT/TauT family transport system ATP-binding protein